MPVTIENGSGGALLNGRRTATEFTKWEAKSREDGPGLRVWVGKHQPDPYEWSQRGETMRAELEVGRGIWTGPARIENEEPLIFTMDLEV